MHKGKVAPSRQEELEDSARLREALQRGGNGDNKQYFTASH
jgi:hypothetical protein